MTANQEIQFEAMRKYMLERYAAELSDKLYYHGVHHVLDVEASVMRIAASLSLTDRELLLLRTAAIFHDYGFIESPHQHEERSCSVAGTLLPDYGYSPSDIATICGMIMATELPQQPQSMLEMIIADADLDYLGRDDYPEIADSLYRELHHQGRVSDRREWLHMQIDFLQRHVYHTTWSQQHRAPTKEARRLLLLQELD
ncbi:MAG: hypothetical protein ABR95_06585 [Sphingobacteriales bacterium BACL12 MAG-120813-bin55]|jgi:uncharacterized protein|nr:MAG: hypothetical protein ABR94_01235 [Sphingobacteriales bacterium BACL12 MAG-120802-bin5]KRP13456.1 MAG: hypothetical protein ABR95_06585 [Sphingobacteriales bacterium BACL12 MAG-120813-bin55]